MTRILKRLSPAEAQARLQDGRAVLVDIREPDEFARTHIAGALSQPLSGWEAAHLAVHPDADVIFTCRSGMRTAGACDRLAARVNLCNPVHRRPCLSRSHPALPHGITYAKSTLRRSLIFLTSSPTSYCCQ